MASEETLETALAGVRDAIHEAQRKMLIIESLLELSHDSFADNEVVVYFDGGVIKEQAYGSFKIGNQPIVRVKHGKKTNNAAEYLTLISALDAVERWVKPETVALRVYGDSKIVLKQICGEYRCSHPALVPLRDRAIELLSQYRYTDLRWVPRENIVRILGH